MPREEVKLPRLKLTGTGHGRRIGGATGSGGGAPGEIQTALALGADAKSDVAPYVQTSFEASSILAIDSLRSLPNIENAEEDYLRAMRIFGKKWKRGSLADDGPHVELLRCGFYKLSLLCQHPLGLIERVNDQPTQDFRTYFMKLEFELGDNGKVTASASNCPKQVGVFIFAGSDPLAVRGDCLDRD